MTVLLFDWVTPRRHRASRSRPVVATPKPVPTVVHHVQPIERVFQALKPVVVVTQPHLTQSGSFSWTRHIRYGIDGNEAVRHRSVIQGSFAPFHEHNMAAVAYLASQWFLDVRYTGDVR